MPYPLGKMRLIYVVAVSATLAIVVIPGASTEAAKPQGAVQAKIEKNKQAEDKIEQKLEDLQNTLKNAVKEEDLSDATRAIVEVDKQKKTLKMALIIYGIINSILWVAENALSMVLPPLGTLVRFLDVVAGGVARKTLDEYFEEFVKAEHEAFKKYSDQHPDVLKDIKIGKKYEIDTPLGKMAGTIRRLPNEPLRKEDLSITNLNVVKFLTAATQLKKKR